MVVWLAVGVVAALLVAGALAHKWELPQDRVLVAVGAAGLLLALVVGLASSIPGALGAAIVFGGSLLVGAALGLWRFYRDPERSPPPDDDVVVSPADGEVIYVHEVERGELPVVTKAGRSYRLDELTKTPFETDSVFVIGIALNFLDVHVNRAPVGGDVTHAERHGGAFYSLKRPEAVFENERATIVVRGRHGDIATVLIASRLVRRISLYVKAHERVSMGARVGAIRFGSQADVVFANDGAARVLVEVGSRVRAGESVLARFDRPPTGG